MKSITISLRLPAKELSPNYSVWTRGKKMAQGRAKREAHKLAHIVTLEALGRRKPPMWEKATLQADFYWPTMGFPDDDNAMASLKKYRDGIAQAGIVTNDKILKQLPWTIQKDAKNPRVEITITEVK